MDKRTEEWSQNARFLDQIIADPRVREILFHHVLCCLIYLEAKRSRRAKGEERLLGNRAFGGWSRAPEVCNSGGRGLKRDARTCLMWREGSPCKGSEKGHGCCSLCGPPGRKLKFPSQWQDT